jgi:hypothetical protein
MTTKRLALSVLCILIAACAGPTINSKYDSEALSNFGRYQTYAWQPNPSGTDARLSPAVGPLVVGAADETLAAKGYRLAAAGQPDFFIVWRVTIGTRQSVSEIDITPRAGTPGGRLPGGPAMRQTVPLTREFNEGTLILDIADGSTGRQVWRGWAQGEIQKAVDPGEREKRIREAVRKILDKFPPKR